MFIFKTKIGKNELEYHEETLKKIFNFSTLISQIPTQCDLCKSDNLWLVYKKTKNNYDYYLVSCKDCGAEVAFGQKKEGGLFLRYGEKMKIYTPSSYLSEAKEKKDEEVDLAIESSSNDNDMDF